MTTLDQQFAQFAVDLGGERSRTDTSDVRLGDANNGGNVSRTQARTRAGASGHGVRRGHKRVGAVIEIKKRGLRTLEQDATPTRQCVVHDADGVVNHRRQQWRKLIEVLGADVLGAHCWTVIDLGEHQVLFAQHDVKLFAEDFCVEQVLHPQPNSRRLVGVRGPNAPLRGAQGVLT